MCAPGDRMAEAADITRRAEWRLFVSVSRNASRGSQRELRTAQMNDNERLFQFSALHHQRWPRSDEATCRRAVQQCGSRMSSPDRTGCACNAHTAALCDRVHMPCLEPRFSAHGVSPKWQQRQRQRLPRVHCAFCSEGMQSWQCREHNGTRVSIPSMRVARGNTALLACWCHFFFLLS